MQVQHFLRAEWNERLPTTQQIMAPPGGVSVGVDGIDVDSAAVITAPFDAESMNDSGRLGNAETMNLTRR